MWALDRPHHNMMRDYVWIHQCRSQLHLNNKQININTEFRSNLNLYRTQYVYRFIDILNAFASVDIKVSEIEQLMAVSRTVTLR